MDTNYELAWMTWLDFRKVTSEKRVVFFGVSDDWTQKTQSMAKLNLVYYVDNSSSWIGSKWKDMDVKSPETLKSDIENCFVVITSSAYESIIPQLIEYGLSPGVDFCVTPALNSLKIITQIHSHQSKLLISSPDHQVYSGLGSRIGLSGGADSLGGLYVYDIGTQDCVKVLDGTFHQIVDTGDEFYVAEEKRGVCRVSRDFELVDSFGVEPGMKPHGIAYWPDRNIVFLGHSTFDKVVGFDAETKEQVFEIELTNKYRKDGLPHHWINDLCYKDGYLYISMFSQSGARAEGVYDGGILQIDLGNIENRYVLVNDAWMPHTVRFFDSQMCYLDSMNGLLYKSAREVIGEFPPFIRGLAYDGVYYYVGQSEVRNFTALKGTTKLIAMTAGFYMFDEETNDEE